MSDELPITPQANYITPVAIGFADPAGNYAQVARLRPLPVTPERGSGPAALAGEASQSLVAGPFLPLPDSPIHLELCGTWTGRAELQRSVDDGATRTGLTVAGVPWARFEGNVNEVVWQEGERGTALFLDITLTSGTLAYRVSQ